MAQPSQWNFSARKKWVIGMVHLKPLPGTPYYEPGSLDAVLEKALADAQALQAGGAHGCLIQTVDRVYSAADECDPARLAAFTRVVGAVQAQAGPGFIVGGQIMRNANRATLGAIKVCGGAFIRCGVFVGAAVTASGTVQADPLALAAYRRAIDAWDVALVAEIDSMHFKWLGGRPLGEIAREAQYAGADAVALGSPDADQTLHMIDAVRVAVPGLPILLSGYTNHANAGRLLAAADGAFVGTALESEGWAGRIDAARVRAYMEIVENL